MDKGAGASRTTSMKDEKPSISADATAELDSHQRARVSQPLPADQEGKKKEKVERAESAAEEKERQ